MKRNIACIIIGLVVFYSATATDYYVSTTGSNTTGTGTSTNPWKTITYALSQISGTGHTLHVAAGTYNSTLGEVFPIYIENGVSLSGEGTGMSIIDGESSGTCISCISIVDIATFFEGFTVTGGDGSQGGAFFISAGSALRISNNEIVNNSASSGSAFYISNSSPKILNNSITSNGTTAVYISGGSPLIKSNRLLNNLENSISVSGSGSAPRILNNIIAFNSSNGIYCYDSCVPTIINNTITDNSSNGIYLYYSAYPDSIINNIISFNSGYGIYESTTGSDPLHVTYNLFYLNSAGYYHDEGSTDYFTSGSLNAGVAECKNNIEGDPLFTDKSINDFHELGYSPVIDAGDPSFSYINEPESNGDRINIGAYGNTFEAAVYSVPPSWPSNLYVNAATGNNSTGDGSSGNPWKTITYALSRLTGTGYTINVAAGTYNNALGELFPIYIKNGISLAGAGIDVSIIDADQTSGVIKCIGISDASTRIEGFTITGGYLTYPDPAYGPGIFISGGSALMIINNKISDNTIYHHPWNMGTQMGAGIYIENSSPSILNNIITNNSGSFSVGTGIYIYNASPFVSGNKITDNPVWSGAYGDGSQFEISGSLSSPLVVNNIISNSTESGMRCTDNSSPSLLRNVMINNNWEGLQVISANPKIINNTISGNSGDGIYLSSMLDSIINNIISYNSGYGINESGGSSDPGKVWYNLFYANSSGVYRDEGSTDYYTAGTMNSGVPECENNIDGDPLFKDKANDDFHISSGSPAIDAGDPDSPHDPDGSRADIGAFYFILPPPDAPVANSPSFIGQTDAILSWNTVTTAAGYYIDLATDAGFTSYVPGFENLDVAYVTSYSINVLTSNTTYYYRIRAYNDSGTGPNSNTVSFITLTSLPPTPAAPVIYDGTGILQTSFLADWDPVDYATSYKLDVGTDNSFNDFVPGYNNREELNTTELTILGLTANTQYFLRVRACNSGGCSSYSDTIPVTTLPYPPSAPDVLHATDTSQTSFTANWNSSADATGYNLDVSTSNTFNSFISGFNNLDVSNAVSFSVTGLTSNTKYYYRVRAYNTGGTSNNSETVTVTTLPDPPAAPVCNDGTDRSQTGFTANWTSSATATGYRLDVAGDADFTEWVADFAYSSLDVGNVTTYSVTGLTSNTTYYYRVAAYNTGGESAHSNVIVVTTLPDPPPAPIAGEATDTACYSFTANWATSSTATGYILDVCTTDDFSVCSPYNLDVGNVTSYNVTGLSANTVYYYRVRAYNEGGLSGNSNTITVTTLQIPAPDAPVAKSPTYVGQTDFIAEWESSTDAIGYYLDVATDAGFSSFVTDYNNRDVGNVMTYGVTSLTANTDYYYRVRAYNEGGTSANSSTISLTTLAEAPEPPSQPVADAATDRTQTSFTANWQSVAAATGYKLDVSKDIDFTNILPAYNAMDVNLLTSYSVTGLTQNTTYYYRIRAYNSGGSSTASNIITVTTLPDPPAAPEAFGATYKTPTGFTANWGSSPTATGYYLDVATDNGFTVFVPGFEDRDVMAVLSYDITGLTPSTTYYYRVRAYNSGGVSNNSNEVNLATLAEMPDLPLAPVAISADDLTQTSFLARWNSVAESEGYILDVSTDNTFTSYVPGYNGYDAGSITSYNVEGLTARTTYYYRIRGYNVSGEGDNSNVITVTTLPEPPPAPSGLSAYSCNNDVYLGWEESDDPYFTRYNIYMGTEEDPTTFYTSVTDVSSNTYTFIGMINGETYYFRVKTIVSPGVESDYSSSVSVRVKTGVIPHIRAKWSNVLICYNIGDSISSFRWYNGNTLLSSGTKQYYVTNKISGSYYVETTDKDGCINSSNVIDIGGGKSISVYPNPAKNLFTLNLSSDALGKTVVTLYNSAGVKALEYKTEKNEKDLSCEISLGNLKDGTYTVEVVVNDEEINYTRLIIIE